MMMSKKKTTKAHPYARFTKAELILRDQLAVDRTLMANERTIMAYLRTIAGFVIAGFTLMKLFPDSRSLMITAVACLVLACVIGVIGTLRFLEKRRHLSLLFKQEHRDLEAEFIGVDIDE